MVRNITCAISRTIVQSFSWTFWKTFAFGLLTTVAAMAVAWLAADYMRDHILLTHFEWDWMNDVFQWFLSIDWIFNIIFFFFMGIIFPPVATVFMTLYLDDIVDAVEGRYYPETLAGKRLRLWHLAGLGVRLALLIILLNILIIPLYLVFFWTAFVPVIMFYLLNSYLLGWGYYEMVAVRHLGVRGAGRHRKSIRGQVMLSGFLIMLLYSVPFINLAAPILGAALLTHIFHLSRRSASETAQSGAGQ